MDIKTYSAHGAHFITIKDETRETTICRSGADESIADALNRYLSDERYSARMVQKRIDFYTQARAIVS